MLPAAGPGSQPAAGSARPGGAGGGAGAEGAQRGGAGGGAAVAVLGQGALEGADHQAAHGGGVAKAHLGLGRVDVDVDQLGRQLEEQRGQGLAVVEQEVAVGGAQGLLAAACPGPGGG